MHFTLRHRYGRPCRPALGGFIITAVILSLLLLSRQEMRPNLVAATVAPPHQARMSDSFVDSMGINTHFTFTDTQYGQFSTYEPLLIASGIRHIRDSNSNSTTCCTQTVYYPELRDLASHGVHTTWINGVPGTWSNWCCSQSAQDQVNNIALVGPGVVEGMEGPNEFDGSGDATWPADLTVFQQQLYQATKASYPAKPVIGPSVAWNDAVTLGNISAYVDYGNDHPYMLWPPQPLSTILDKEFWYHQTYAFPGRPQMATETGYPTSTDSLGVSEAVQAKYIPRTFLESFVRNSVRTWDFQLLDGACNTSFSEDNFGLIRCDNSLKPSYHAVQDLASLLSDPGTAFAPGQLAYGVSAASTVHQLLLQKRNGTFQLVLWNEVSSADTDTSQSATLSFAQTVNASAYLPGSSSGTSAVANYSGTSQITLSVPDHPLILTISPTSSTPPPPPVGTVLQGRMTATTSQPNPMTVSLPAPSNPGDTLVLIITEAWTSTFQLPPGWQEVSRVTGGSATIDTWYYPSNPQSIQYLSFTSNNTAIQWSTELSELSGGLTADVSGTATGNSAMANVSSSGATAQGGDIAVGTVTVGNGYFISTSSGWTLQDSEIATNGDPPNVIAESQYELNSSMTPSLSSALSGSYYWEAAIDSFAPQSSTSPTQSATSTPTPTPTPTSSPTPDITPPTVSITSPANNSIVVRKKTETITAQATDDVAVASVRFSVNGTTLCTDTVTTYTCNWTVTGKPNASYTIQATATDLAGNSAVATVTVTSTGPR